MRFVLAFCSVVFGIFLMPSTGFACYSQCAAQCGGTSDTGCIPMCMSSCSSTSDGAAQQGGSAAKQYGSIAFSKSTMSYGLSHNYASRQTAEAVAMDYCAKAPDMPKDCKVAVWFYNRCAALAIKSSSPGKADGAWAAEHAASRRSSEKKAMASCRKYAGQAAKECKIAESFCSR